MTKRRYASFISTVMGYVVAISNAWLTIDWNTFDFTSKASWIAATPKLFLSAMIAIGGHMTSINALRGRAL